MKYLMLAISGVLAFYLLYEYLPAGIDWQTHYRPAALAMLQGDSPYIGYGYYNPPWTLLPLIPIALLPERLGRVVIFLMSAAGFVFILSRLHAKPITMLLFFTASPVFICLINGNLDWLPMLSLFMPVPFGLMVAIIKPQVGIGIGIYWLIESWNAGGIRPVIRNFLPVTLLLTGSMLIYGLPLEHLSALTGTSWNLSIFPYEVPIAMYLLWSAIARKSSRISLASSPFFSPYFDVFSLSAPLTALLEHPRLLLFASACLWSHIVVLAYFK